MDSDEDEFPATPTLREALIYANDTPGAETITFARRLSGQTLTLADGTDTGDAPDPLPWLCGANTTLDGDVNGDGTADITLDGTGSPAGTDGLVLTAANITVTNLQLTNMPDIGIHVLHRTTLTPPRTVTRTQITNTTITKGTHGIQVQAGDGDTAGRLSNTTLRANTITQTSAAGIGVVTEGAGSTLTNTTIEQNNIYANTGHGIAAWSEVVNPARRNSLTGLTIRDNQIHDQTTGSGITVTGGFCGGSYNRVQATITANTLSKNGQANTFPAIAVTGGSNAGTACTTQIAVATETVATEGNRLDVTLTDNISEDPPDIGLALTGGTNHADSTADSTADDNEVRATLTENTVWRSGVTGLALTGGTNHANANTVTATLTNNLVARPTALPAGETAGHGLALRAATTVPAGSTSSENTLTVSGRNNIIALTRDSGDMSHYDILRAQNNADPTRTDNTLTDRLTATIFATSFTDPDIPDAAITESATSRTLASLPDPSALPTPPKSMPPPLRWCLSIQCPVRSRRPTRSSPRTGTSSTSRCR